MGTSLPVTIREALPRDAVAVAGILIEAGLSRDEALTDRVAYILASSANMSLVAEASDRVIACLLATGNGFHVIISHLAVDEQWRKRGLGRLLHDGLLERARGIGALGIIVDSWLTAAGFYHRLGYRTPGAVFLIRPVEGT